MQTAVLNKSGATCGFLGIAAAIGAKRMSNATHYQ
jgi:hypothetical protein